MLCGRLACAIFLLETEPHWISRTKPATRTQMLPRYWFPQSIAHLRTLCKKNGARRRRLLTWDVLPDQPVLRRRRMTPKPTRAEPSSANDAGSGTGAFTRLVWRTAGRP